MDLALRTAFEMTPLLAGSKAAPAMGAIMPVVTLFAPAFVVTVGRLVPLVILEPAAASLCEFIIAFRPAPDAFT